MIRFFVPPEKIHDGRIVIEGQEFAHAVQVLRHRTGDTVLVMDGTSREYSARIETVSEKQCIAVILDEKAIETEVPVHITLCQALIKPSRFEVILEKATELGVSSIVPILCEYCSHRDREFSPSRRTRWNAILKSAACQSGRAVVPDLREPVTFASAVESLSASRIILFSPIPAASTVRKEFHDVRSIKSCILFLGPEGGFSPDEVALAQSRGIAIVSMGKRILRAETAAIAALALVAEAVEEG
ncbi:MAG: 16S rRNA (uracil(1498)-N(3))-methyltransferase [Candidatus Xenobiia bacterium LiM19]